MVKGPKHVRVLVPFEVGPTTLWISSTPYRSPIIFVVLKSDMYHQGVGHPPKAASHREATRRDYLMYYWYFYRESATQQWSRARPASIPCDPFPAKRGKGGRWRGAARCRRRQGTCGHTSMELPYSSYGYSRVPEAQAHRGECHQSNLYQQWHW